MNKRYYCGFCKRTLKYKSHAGWMAHNGGDRHQRKRSEFYLRELQANPKAREIHSALLREYEERGARPYEAHPFESVLGNPEYGRALTPRAAGILRSYAFPEAPDIRGFHSLLARLLPSRTQAAERQHNAEAPRRKKTSARAPLR